MTLSHSYFNTLGEPTRVHSSSFWSHFKSHSSIHLLNVCATSNGQAQGFAEGLFHITRKFLHPHIECVHRPTCTAASFCTQFQKRKKLTLAATPSSGSCSFLANSDAKTRNPENLTITSRKATLFQCPSPGRNVMWI